jgi:hypothetical protein
MGKHRQQPRHAYLLRGWQEESPSFDDTVEWRFSVEELLSKRWRKGFTSIQDLLDFLEAELACAGSATPESGCDEKTESSWE